MRAPGTSASIPRSLQPVTKPLDPLTLRKTHAGPFGGGPQTGDGGDVLGTGPQPGILAGGAGVTLPRVQVREIHPAQQGLETATLVVSHGRP